MLIGGSDGRSTTTTTIDCPCCCNTHSILSGIRSQSHVRGDKVHQSLLFSNTSIPTPCSPSFPISWNVDPKPNGLSPFGVGPKPNNFVFQPLPSPFNVGPTPPNPSNVKPTHPSPSNVGPKPNSFGFFPTSPNPSPFNGDPKPNGFSFFPPSLNPSSPKPNSFSFFPPSPNPSPFNLDPKPPSLFNMDPKPKGLSFFPPSPNPYNVDHKANAFGPWPTSPVKPDNVSRACGMPLPEKAFHFPPEALKCFSNIPSTQHDDNNKHRPIRLSETTNNKKWWADESKSNFNAFTVGQGQPMHGLVHWNNGPAYLVIPLQGISSYFPHLPSL